MEDDVKQASTDRYAVAQAYRWKAERDKARQELAMLRDSSRDTTVSAYDLLPKEERDAIAWVREHGGLDSVRELLDWVVGHCSTKQQLDFDFWLSGRVMHELGFDEDMADRDEVERRLLARLMPEGYEWPRYESGEPLRYEDRYVYDGREREVWHVDFDSYGEPTILNKDGTRFHPDKGERVNRPAPKVLDADGVEIRVGDTAYEIETGERYFVTNVFDGMTEPDFPEHTVECRKYEDVVTHMFRPSQLTHRAPVLAADGRPLREGETVWGTKGNGQYIIDAIEDDGVVRIKGNDLDYFGADFTHERPDTWKRLENDANAAACLYFGASFKDCENCDHDSWECSYDKARDLVRRAKKLAERGQ